MSHEAGPPGIRGAAPPLNVASLPSFAFSHRGPLWWATLGMVAIEGTVFALAIGTYFYLRDIATVWPPSTPPPALLWGTLNTLVMLASALPNHLVKRKAESQDRTGAAIWLWICIAFSLVFLTLRVFEFGALNVRWDTDAYGSIVWTLLGLHTAHLITDTIDTVVLGVMLLTGPWEQRRFVDVAENGDYWYFVMFSWLPIYGVIYWAPRIWS